MQRALLIPTLIVALAALLSLPASAADDWSFIAGRYALDAKDCGPLAKGEPFSKNLVSALSQEVLTREGITSPREVHCKFRSAAKTENGWTVKADCEEMGQSSPAELAVTAGADGSLAVVNEDVYGPEPQKFQLCRE
jgi:hypothetical protein